MIIHSSRTFFFHLPETTLQETGDLPVLKCINSKSGQAPTACYSFLFIYLFFFFVGLQATSLLVNMAEIEI